MLTAANLIECGDLKQVNVIKLQKDLETREQTISDFTDSRV